MSISTTDPRISVLLSWLSDSLSLNIQSLEAASSDASFRRYFRLKYEQACQIVMDAPPDKENIEPFLRIAALFRSFQLRVPDIYFTNLELGFLVLEDFGSSSLLEILNTENVDQFYRIALNSVFKLQTSATSQTVNLPAYDKPLLERELGVFHEWFLQGFHDLQLPAEIKTVLHDILIASALEQPQVCVHRDYHSRNLMVLKNHELGIIDFQDAVIGPITYDLVSLLRDCYIHWPTAWVERWVYQYYLQLLQAKQVSVDFKQFKRWFDLIGLQRHLKAIGIFSRLHLRDTKSSYLADIPRTLNYVKQVCASYPELADFNLYLQQHILPLYPDEL
jgi:aminoglycoside/choline kinase family phosphotransferase